MMLLDHDDRLVVVNDDATEGVIWSVDNACWVEAKGDFPRKAWLDGTMLSPAKAAAEFPEADLSAIPFK